jgi:hypothetical protein
MSALNLVWRELIGLFVDDRSFALVILVVVAAAAVVAYLLPGETIFAGAVLLVGCFAALIESVVRTKARN